MAVMTTCACALAGASASALASAPARPGTILSLDRAHHRLRLIDSHNRAQRFGYRGRLARGIVAGRRVAYRTRGGTLSSIRALARAHSVSFYGRVVRSSAAGLVLRLNDGSTYRVAPSSRPHGRRARAAASLTLNLQGLQPGQVVLVTISDDGKGNTLVTVKLIDSSVHSTSQDPTVDDQQAEGTVVSIVADQSSITVDVPGTGNQTFTVQDPGTLDGVAVGDLVDVSYYEDGASLVADDVSAVDTGSAADSSPDAAAGSTPSTPGDLTAADATPADAVPGDTSGTPTSTPTAD